MEAPPFAFPKDSAALLELVERMLRYASGGFCDVFVLLHEIEAAGRVELAHDHTVWSFLLRRALDVTEGKLNWTQHRHRKRSVEKDVGAFREAVYAPRNRQQHLCVGCLRMTGTLYPIEWARLEPRLREPWMIWCTNCWHPEMWPRPKALLHCPKLLREHPHLLHTKVGDGGIVLYSVAELRYWATMPEVEFQQHQSASPSPAAPPIEGRLARNNYRKRKERSGGDATE